MGGRPQQILAVLLTYFAITTSYIPVFIYHQIKEPVKTAQTPSAPGKDQPRAETRPPMSLGAVLAVLVLLTAVAPFLSLGSGVGGIIGLFIIFIGLQRAWALTGRTEILIMGPYAADPAQ